MIRLKYPYIEERVYSDRSEFLIVDYESHYVPKYGPSGYGEYPKPMMITIKKKPNILSWLIFGSYQKRRKRLLKKYGRMITNISRQEAMNDEKPTILRH